MANINVTGPDGSTFSFPEGTAPDVISGALKSHYTAAPPDKYAQSAQDELGKMKAAGIPTQEGYARRVLQGATLGGADEIMAGLSTPLEMISHGTFNPVEGYKYAKAVEDAKMDEARQRQGALGTAAEIAGGLGTGASLGSAGFTLAKAGAGLLSRAGRFAAEGAGYGGVSGFLDGGNSLDDRLTGAAKGAGIGAATGGAIPVVAAAGKAIAAPVVSNIRARINPEGVAASQVARAIGDSGRAVPDITSDVQSAATSGQPMYTVADAMGFPGQRLLRMGVDAPGPGRNTAVDFLEQRQAGQARRIANALSEGFDAPQTAKQTETALTASRDTAADSAYGAARQNAGPVDVSPAIKTIDDTLSTGVNQIVSPGSGIANDSIESALSNFRSRLTDGKSNLTDFTAVQRVRGDIADAANSALRAGQGNKARLLGGVLKQLDGTMENASQGYKAANQQYAAGSRAIDAVDAGRTAAMRGRPEDTIPNFRAMPPQQQAAYRAGYVDPLIEQTTSAAMGVNKARPFTSDAFKSESQAISPLSRGNEMSQRLAREQRMFETRAEATGGSKTSMNLADQEAQKVDPALIADIGHSAIGNPGAIARLYSRVTDGLNGYTPAVREHIVNLLLDRGSNPQTQAAISGELAKLNSHRAVAAALTRGLMLGSSTYLPRAR